MRVGISATVSLEAFEIIKTMTQKRKCTVSMAIDQLVLIAMSKSTRDLSKMDAADFMGLQDDIELELLRRQNEGKKLQIEAEQEEKEKAYKKWRKENEYLMKRALTESNQTNKPVEEILFNYFTVEYDDLKAKQLLGVTPQ